MKNMFDCGQFSVKICIFPYLRIISL